MFRKGFRGFPRPMQLSSESETDLEQKEFLERQPVPRALPRDAIRRMVHFPDRFLRGGKLFRGADFRGEDVADVGETEIHRRVHDFPEPFLRQSGRRVIHRNDPADCGRVFPFVQDLEFRTQDDRLPRTRIDPAEKGDHPPRRENPFDVGPVEP